MWSTFEKDLNGRFQMKGFDQLYYMRRVSKMVERCFLRPEMGKQ
jgi:hypothetical protein